MRMIIAAQPYAPEVDFVSNAEKRQVVEKTCCARHLALYGHVLRRRGIMLICLFGQPRLDKQPPPFQRRKFILID